MNAISNIRHFSRRLTDLFVVLLIFLALLAVVIPVGAQDGKVKVSDDDVNNVARRLYCPVCENIPLDTCGTTACAQWRQEIRIQLEAGRTPQQVIDDFVLRYGDRVVGTPQDPALRALSLVTPWAVSAVAVIGAVVIFSRWRKEKGQTHPAPEADSVAPDKPRDEYRARLERDLAQRR